MNQNNTYTLFLLIISLLMIAMASTSRAEDYGPDVGDKFHGGESFDYIAFWGSGYLGLKNPSDHSVTIKTTQTDELSSIYHHFKINAHGHVCFTFSGATSFVLSGKGYVEIVEDSTVSSIPKHCKNYFGLVPEDSISNSASDIAKLAEAGIEILGDIAN